jgi:hypothetical protein
MPDKKFDLGDYIEVKDRIAKFYDLYGNGRLVTGEVRLTTEPDGVPRVLVQGLAYRTPDDPLPGQGWSWMALPGTTSYTKGSELENTETSAWGRAIGSLGILIDRSIASANEVQNKQGAAAPAYDRTAPITVGTQEVTPDGGLIGTAIIQGNQDFNLRQSPDGYTLPFRIKNGARSFIVLAENELAQAVELVRSQILDQRVTVWGHWTDEVIPAKGVKPEIKYRILHLTKLQTPDFVLPADDLLPQPPDDVSLVGEKPEAETAPLFDELPI